MGNFKHMKRKILLVDDDPPTSALIRKGLEKHHYVVMTAQNGLDAYQRVKEDIPDLIIMDNLMPKISGYQFVEKVRPHDPILREIPIIIMSARESMGNLFHSADICAFFSKPIDFDKLLEAVVAAIGPSSEGHDIADTERKMLIAGVDEYMIKKLTQYFRENGYRVMRGQDEAEALRMAAKLDPSLVLIQFWEESHKFNAADLYKNIRSIPALSNVPVLAYVTEGVSVEAMKYIDRRNLLSYKESKDLIEKLDDFLKRSTLPS